MEVLQKLQTIHSTFQLKKNFAQEEQNVKVQTAEVKRLFISSKKAVDKIDTSREPRSQEELLKRNLKISLVNELNDLSKQFRDEQAEYLKNLERMKARRRENMTKYDEDETDLDPEEKQRIIELEQKLQGTVTSNSIHC